MTGCQSEPDGRIATHPAMGKVQVKGQPKQGIVVQLVPDESNLLSSTRLRPGGVSKSDGTFELTTYSSGDGAPEGKYRLVLFWPPTSGQEFGGGPGEGKSPKKYKGPPDQFQGKYFSAEKSPWEITIVKGNNELGSVEID
ncbi:MAG: hypothetical protein AAF497_01000 [Planctomycetota bacterium]